MALQIGGRCQTLVMHGRWLTDTRRRLSFLVGSARWHQSDRWFLGSIRGRVSSPPKQPTRRKRATRFWKMARVWIDAAHQLDQLQIAQRTTSPKPG